MDKLLDQLILLKPFALISAVMTLILMTFLLVVCRNFDWNRKSTRVIGFFYESSMKDSVTLAICLLKLYLIISIFVTKGKIELIHIVFFGVLVLAYNLIRRNLREFGVSIFNGLIIMAVLYVSNFLIVYSKVILFDIKIVISVVFLAVFLLLYSLYDIATCVYNIICDRKGTE